MEIICPCCHSPITVVQPVLIDRKCRLCERSFTVEYLEADDHWDWLCPSCYGRMEQENEEFRVQQLSQSSEDQLLGI